MNILYVIGGNYNDYLNFSTSIKNCNPTINCVTAIGENCNATLIQNSAAYIEVKKILNFDNLFSYTLEINAHYQNIKILIRKDIFIYCGELILVSTSVLILLPVS